MYRIIFAVSVLQYVFAMEWFPCSELYELKETTSFNHRFGISGTKRFLPQLEVLYNKNRFSPRMQDVQLECANLTVPLDWNNSAEGTIPFWVWKLSSSSNSTKQLWMLNGGPGSVRSVTDVETLFRTRWFNTDSRRDHSFKSFRTGMGYLSS